MSVINNNTLAGASGQGGGGFVIEKSLRFTKGDSAYLSRTFSGTPNKKKFTFSVWFKGAVEHSHQYLLQTQHVSSNYFEFTLNAFKLQAYNAVPSINVTLARQLRDPAAWYHAVLAVDTTQAVEADRLKIYLNGEHQTDYISGGSTFPAQNAEFELPNRDWYIANAYFNSTSQSTNFFDGYMAEFHYVDGEAKDVTDFGAFDDNGVWQAAKYSGSHGTNGFHLDFADGSNIGNDAAGSNNWNANNLVGSIPDISTNDVTVFRDGAVYASGNPGHMFDSNKATYSYAGSNNAANYIDWSPTGGYETSGHIWIQGGNGNGGGCDSMTVTINGSTVTRSAVVDNETYTNAGYGWGDWHKYTVSGNTLNSLRVTGVYALIRQLSTVTDPTHATLGISNDNDVPVIEIVDPVNLDLLRDSPTNGNPADDTEAGGVLSGNYCTWNPLAEQKSDSITLSNGNLTATVGSTRSSFFGTMALEGKTYWEIVFTGGAYIFGMTDASMFNTTANTAPNRFIGETSTSWSIGNDGTVYNNGVSQGSETSWANGDVMGWSYDSSNGAIKIYKNGTLNGSYTASTANTYFPAATLITSGASVDVNFGQRPFAYTAPSGYKALCTTNLTPPNVPDGSAYFDAKTWVGSGGLEFASTSLDTSTAYRHHRILFEGDNNGGSVSEIQFFDASGLIDASDTNNTGGSISSNNNQVGSSDGLAAWTAFNGTLGGAGYANGVRKDPSSGFYIAKDWGSGVTKTVTGVKIWGVNGYALAGNSSSTYVKLQGSNDGSTWTDLQTWDNSRTGSWTSSSSTQVAHTSDTARKISGYKFSPDFAWIKNRTDASSHHLYDTVRGVEKRLASDSSSGEDDYGSSNPGSSLTAFNSDGFSVGDFNGINGSGDAMVGWAWDAGNSNTPISVGDLNSSVYDQSQRWRNYLTSSSGYTTGYGPEKAFNGVFDGTGGAAGDVANATFTFTPPAMTVTSLEVNVYSSLTITLPDGTTQSVSGSSTVDNNRTVDIGSGFSFTGSNSIVFTPNSGALVYLERIKINGKELVDDDITVTNVPSIASTYRANPSAGFSIVTWTGTGSAGNLAHGLGKTPELIITKVYGDPNYADNWPVYHPSYGAGTYTYLNDTRAAPASYTGFFNGVEPDSSVFTVGSANSDNTKNLIGYCFTSVSGYSSFGSYTGSGSGGDAGPFVALGFQPAFVLIKSKDYAGNWNVYDNGRFPNNPKTGRIFVDTNGAEGAVTDDIDFLSNGFKIRTSGLSINGSGNTHFFAAFAENPFQANGGLAR